MIWILIALWAMSMCAAYVYGLHKMTRRCWRLVELTKRAQHHALTSQAREKELHAKCNCAIDAYNKLVRLYNRDVHRDDSKDADWWRNVE